MKRYSELTKTRYKKKILDGLTRNLGILTPVLKTLKLSYTTYRKWYNEDIEFRNNVLNIKEIAIDFVESKLFDNIKNGDKTSIIFYLKTIGKHRGYIEKTEVNQNVSYIEPLKLNIIIPNKLKTGDKKKLNN